MSDPVIIAAITGGVAILSAPLLVIVKRLTEIRRKTDETHGLVNSQLTAANTKVEVRDATIAELRAQLALAVKLQAKTEREGP